MCGSPSRLIVPGEELFSPSPVAVFIAYVRGALAKAEAKYGLWVTSLVAGVVLTTAAAIYVTPFFRPINHGVWYCQMSVSPIDPGSQLPVRLRVLSPLIAHFLFLRGKAFPAFPLLMTVCFNGTVYWHCRRRGLDQAVCLGIAALMAFSTPTLFQLHFAGYADSLSFLLLFICINTADRPYIWGPLFAAALFNHESNFFLAPVIVLHALGPKPSVGRSIISIATLVLAVVPVAVFRAYMEAHAPVVFSESSYLNLQNLASVLKSIVRDLALGFFMAYKLFWLIPIAAIATGLRRRHYFQLLAVVLPIVCASAQLLVALDISRLIGAAFPSIIFAATSFAEASKRGTRFARSLWGLIFLNLLIPQYYIGSGFVTPLLPLPVSLVLQALHLHPWGPKFFV